MKKKKYTRKTPRLFTNLKKTNLPLGHFKTQVDLFHAFVDWLDYYDPIGLVRIFGLRQEYEPEAADLSLYVQNCESADKFAMTLHQCLISWFSEEDLRENFLQRFHLAAEDGWALWRRFQFDIQKQPDWIAEQNKLAQFGKPIFDDEDRLIFHQLVCVDGIDCLFRKRMHSGETLDFIKTEVAHLSDTQIIQKAQATGLIFNKSNIEIQHRHPDFITVVFLTQSAHPTKLFKILTKDKHD